MKIKITTIVGARPQFIKASAVSRAFKQFNQNSDIKIEETIIHTGQHFDASMSSVFFEELNLPTPAINLGVNSLSNNEMTAQQILKLEPELRAQNPDCVLVYGDTNSTLAGALCAAKLNILVCHVEAGLRSFNREMPEELNRILTDHCSEFLYAPTSTAMENLVAEGLSSKSTCIGDVMYDVARHYKKFANYSVFDDIPVKADYCLVTIHRQDNTSLSHLIKNIPPLLEKVSESMPVIFPMHPRLKSILDQNVERLIKNARLHLIEPVSYLRMLALLDKSALVMTDSGGLQKEAYFFQTPSIVLRQETEWKELVELGYSRLFGLNEDLNSIPTLIEQSKKCRFQNKEVYGNGGAGKFLTLDLVSRLEHLRQKNKNE